MDKLPENPHMGHSVFSMSDVNAVAEMRDLAAAKRYAIDLIEKSTANAKNKAQISAVVLSSKDIVNLSLSMANHILAHPSENLKVIR